MNYEVTKDPAGTPSVVKFERGQAETALGYITLEPSDLRSRYVITSRNELSQLNGRVFMRFDDAVEAVFDEINGIAKHGDTWTDKGLTVSIPAPGAAGAA